MALEDTALRLIRKFGEERQVTLLQPSASPVDPAKPFNVDPTSSESSLTAPAVVVPIRRSLIDGNSVRQGDETVLVAGLSFGSTVPNGVFDFEGVALLVDGRAPDCDLVRHGLALLQN